MDPNHYIQPSSKDPRYWQYKGRQLLLIGGSNEDNLFQIDGLKEHLDDMHAVGANYIRTTMSDRDPGDERAYVKNGDGKYDLNQWNPVYWEQFSNLLDWCEQRDIIVQIELWDRFDHSQQFWETDPWNPCNNCNFTYEETGFAPEYPRHPCVDHQVFFHSVPAMEQYQPKFDIIRTHQEAFIDKMLSISLPHPNVLYCMNNETSTSEIWGHYWIDYIKTKASEYGVPVFTTDMFDNFWKGPESEKVAIVRGDPDHYSFADISQVNSRNFKDTHWEQSLYLIREMHKHPRPVNTTKTYGGGESEWGSGTNKDGVDRLWRNLLTGCASVRFHRPESGCGLRPIARTAIKAARLAESLQSFMELSPSTDNMVDRIPDSAYSAAAPGGSSIVFFPEGKECRLKTSITAENASVTWISIHTGEKLREETVAAKPHIFLNARNFGCCAAVIKP